MKRLIALATVGSLLAAPLAAADPRHGPPGHRGHSAPYHGYYGGYRYPYTPVYYRHGHHNGNDSDDAAWAIGGLVLGAIIGTAAAKAEQREVQGTQSQWSSTPLPPPQKRKVVTCYDEVAYDREGEPYVARQCSEDWR
ncbi:MAG: hypothetical protein NDI84_12890 [Steroidobacteraceae bacterium]|nr:hypothetical protein [Steroidobacteraceae bacterium]